MASFTGFTSTAALCTALVLAAPIAAAQGPPAAPSPPAAPVPSDRDAAKERFERGRDLFKREAWAPALAEFLESRRLYPTSNNTAHAAVCLRQLGRVDESLEMYATLLRDFGDKLAPDAKQQALQEIEETRRLVGTVEVEGSVAGATIVVDQQDRGAYPLLSPLRVPAGSHVVRVYKEGYEPFEKHLDVAGGATVHVTARLVRLKETGTLQVSESLGRALAVVVDGMTVGKTGEAPLLLPLAPGKHVVHLRGEGNLGTAPAVVIIKVNEVEPLRIEAEQLDALLRVDPLPFDALVSVDRVLLGRGRWEGRVRTGKHTIEVGAEGFLAETRNVMIGRDKREVVAVPLPRDPRSPFWRKPPPPPHWLVEVAGAVALAPSFGGDVVGACTGACSQGVGSGGYGVARVGYELSSGIGFGLTAGYLSMQQSTTGRDVELQVVGRTEASGRAADRLLIRGALVGGWVGLSLGERVPVHLRLGAGGVVGFVQDRRTGKLTTVADTKTYDFGPVIEAPSTAFVYVAPEIRVGLPLGKHLELNAGVELLLLVSPGRARWDAGHRINASTDGEGYFAADALTGGVVVAFSPGVGARYDF